MSASTVNPKSPTQKDNILTRVRKDLIGTLLISIVLLLAAGRPNWRMGWVYIGLNFIGLIVNWIILISKNPEVLAARAQITQEDSKPWDRLFTAFYGPMLLIIMIISGLDAGRFSWSIVPSWLQIISVILFIFGWGFSLWAMVSNKYFETSVRIQEDRGHSTVSAGPYAIVRHPGYSGIALLYAVSPLFLGSWWGLIPSALLTAGFVIRTSLEDKALNQELADYHAYSQKVRYRLIPGIW